MALKRPWVRVPPGPSKTQYPTNGRSIKPSAREPGSPAESPGNGARRAPATVFIIKVELACPLQMEQVVVVKNYQLQITDQ